MARRTSFDEVLVLRVAFSWPGHVHGVHTEGRCQRVPLRAFRRKHTLVGQMYKNRCGKELRDRGAGRPRPRNPKISGIPGCRRQSSRPALGRGAHPMETEPLWFRVRLDDFRRLFH